MKDRIIELLVVIIVILGLVVFTQNRQQVSDAVNPDSIGANFKVQASTPTPTHMQLEPTRTPIPTATPTPIRSRFNRDQSGPTPLPVSSVLLPVPFASQAPFGNWSDPRFQDGCEEASAIMAMAWVRGELLDKTQMEAKIIDLATYQEKAYGDYRDTSAKDTVERIFKGYFRYTNIRVQENITIEGIKNELVQGYLVIVPANGQALGNPNFTPPGPERHNLVIKGYDDQTGEFVTNDPGTRLGESYRYPYQVLFNAIRDYPTGYHIPISKTEKIMIVVKPA